MSDSAWRLVNGIFGSTVFALALWSCGGGSSGGTSITTGIEAPSQIDIISSKNGATSNLTVSNVLTQAQSTNNQHVLYMQKINGLRLWNRASVDDLLEDSDYHQTIVRRFVDIKALDVFSIIDQILNATDQTNHEENLGAGCYVAKVAWQDQGEGGSTQTQLQDWTIEANAADLDGDGNADEELIHCFITEIDPFDGDVEHIRVRFELLAAPTKNQDGSNANLGEWNITAVFSDDESEYFFAQSEVLANGDNEIVIEDQFVETDENTNESFDASTRAYILRAADGNSGLGQIAMPDWEACFGSPDGPGGNCPPPQVEINFEYDPNYLCVRSPTRGTECFDRTQELDIVHRYKLFACTDGADVEKTKSFGFPVTVINQNNISLFGWYGAWQDYHQLWVNGEQVADGTSVIKEDFTGEAEDISYTAKSFAGALQKVTIQAGSVNQIAGIPVEIFLWNDHRLRYNGTSGNWEECPYFDCSGSSGALVAKSASELALLQYAGDGDARDIYMWSDALSTNLVYLTVSHPDATSGAGFYQAQQGSISDNCSAPPQWQSNGSLYSPADGDEMYYNIGGRTYIGYTGEFAGPTTTTGWVEKTLSDFDCQTWTPEFDDTADREFLFEVGREYFINNRGVNMRATRFAENGNADDYSVFVDSYEVAKPNSSLDTLIPDGLVLVDPFNPSGSTYELDKNENSASYLLLVYNTVGAEEVGINVGDVVTQDLWGLRAQGDTGNLAAGDTLYNWSYQDPNLNETWGGVTYLVDENGSYALLSDPIRLDPIDLENAGGDTLTYTLMFDGWLHGLPDTWWELQKIGFSSAEEDTQTVSDILDKNVIIPDGTELADADTGDCYFVKAVEVSIFLVPIPISTNGVPDVGADSPSDLIDLDEKIPAVDLTEALALVKPDNCELRYIEGNPVE